MTENTPSDAMAIWEAAYSAAMLAGIDDEAGAAIIDAALAERDAEIARLRANAKANNDLARMYKAQVDEFRAKYVVADRAGYERGQRETVARIVAWLRGQAIAIERLHDEATMDEQRKPLKIMAKARVVCADAIEAGEWE